MVVVAGEDWAHLRLGQLTGLSKIILEFLPDKNFNKILQNRNS